MASKRINFTRREALKTIACSAAAGMVSPALGAFAHALQADEPTAADRGAMAQVASDFMEKFDVPGLSVAMAHSGRLVYESAFGEACRQPRERLSVNNLFRIASVSKPAERRPRHEIWQTAVQKTGRGNHRRPFTHAHLRRLGQQQRRPHV